VRPTVPRSFLIIQTAFIGDVILATALIEKLHQYFPDAEIDFLLRKGNETLLRGHPFVRNVMVWDKKKHKVRNLIQITRRVRSLKFDYVIDIHRFFSSGLIALFSNAKYIIGFDKNPVSFLFTKKVKHVIQKGIHEIDRNQKLIDGITDERAARPRLYPSANDYAAAHAYQVPSLSETKYICLAPASVWFTKQFPQVKWIEFMDRPEVSKFYIVLLGAATDHALCESLRIASKHGHVINLAGHLSYLESAALMQGAIMNYVNDSAPLHLASAMNAPVTALFCSTIPAFGFGPLSDVRYVVETEEKLSCRPCGLHGYRACPQGHFKCARTVRVAQLSEILENPGFKQ